MNKLVSIEFCNSCPHCSYSSESPTWDGYCMKCEREVEDTCVFPSWCPLDNA